MTGKIRSMYLSTGNPKFDLTGENAGAEKQRLFVVYKNIRFQAPDVTQSIEQNTFFTQSFDLKRFLTFFYPKM